MTHLWRSFFLKHWLDLALATLWFGLVLCIRASTSPGHDAIPYLQGAQCFLAKGLDCGYEKEPLFPVFLAFLMLFKIEIAKLVPLAQNLLFLLSTYLALTQVMRGPQARRRFRTALAISFVPTFLVTMNGAIYTESLSASLTLLQLALLFRILDRPVSSKLQLGAVILGLGLLSGALTLIKGTYFFIEILFGVLLLATLSLMKLRKTRTLRTLPLLAASAAIAFAPPLAKALWNLAGASSAEAGSFGRGGIILYGRTEYAKHFSFKRDSLPFLANALSEKLCLRLYDKRCNDFGFRVENSIGYEMLRDAKHSDTELFELGKRNILEQPILQATFAFFEWARFIFHHGTTGFAQLEAPLIGPVIHSTPFNLLLKLANLLIYVGLFLIPFKKGMRSSLALQTIALFCVAYILPYGFATTVVRMIYPVAPLLLISLLLR